MLKKPLLSLFVFMVVLAGPLWAQEVSYDRYASLFHERSQEKPSKTQEALQNFGKHFLVYPFELVRWPIDQTLVFADEYHLYDKADWIYDQMKNYGFTPHIRSLFGGDGLGGGFELELVKLLRQKERFPNFTLKGSTLWTLDSITEYKAQVLQDRIAGTGLRAGGNFKYENRGEEHFYGIGPHTSLGDGTSYRLERTTLESLLGYAFWATWDLQGKFAYQNVNITNGEDGGRGIIDKIFVESGRQAIPGLGGDELLTLGFDLNHDNRDSQDMPTTGGYERFHFSWNKGIESGSGFFKYRGEASHFFKLLSERRVFALRGVVEHNDEFGDREVPLFSMARLGGYGAGLRYGDVHRGYKRDRFYDESLLLFNAEYRWAAWEYRDWRMDPVLFCDLGQVFGEWSGFQFEDFRVSYGLGFRVSFEKEVVLTFDIARSNEGTEFYVKTRTPF